jgi:hypothetical protein
MGLGLEEGVLLLKEASSWKGTGYTCSWKIAKICEVRIPLESVNPEPGGNFFVYITLIRDNVELGRWPADASMVLKYAGPELELETWLI